MSLKRSCGPLIAAVAVFILSTVSLWFWLPPVPRARLPLGAQAWPVASTPGGDTLAWGGLHEATVWSVDRGEKIAAVPGGPAHTATWPKAISPDGTHLATMYFSNELYLAVWKIPSGEELLALPRKNRHPTTTLFTPDGRTFVVLAIAESPPVYPSVVTAWDVASGQSRVVVSSPSHLSCLAMSPDGKTLAAPRGKTPNSSGAILLWDFATGEDRAVIECDNIPYAVAFTPDGGRLLAAYLDDTLRVWNIATGTQERVFPERTEWVERIRFSAQGDLVAIEEGYYSPPGPVTQFLPSWALPPNQHWQVVLWDFHTGRKLAALPMDYRLLAFDDRGSTLMTYDTGAIQWWDIPPHRPVARVLAWSAAASAVTFCLVSFSAYLVFRSWRRSRDST